jgi:hypothetical protein
MTARHVSVHKPGHTSEQEMRDYLISELKKYDSTHDGKLSL